MVDLYYQYGKGPARMIENNPWAKPFVRLVLYPAVGMAWLSLSTGAAEKAAAGMALAVFLVAAGRYCGRERSWPSGIGAKRLCLIFLVTMAGLGIVLPQPVHATTIFRQVGIASSPNPVGSGARAMGMAGAFIAIADDATAASWTRAASCRWRSRRSPRWAHGSAGVKSLRRARCPGSLAIRRWMMPT